MVENTTVAINPICVGLKYYRNRINKGVNTTMGEKNTTPVGKNPTAVPFSVDGDGIRRRIFEIKEKHGFKNNKEFSQFLFGNTEQDGTIEKWAKSDSTTIPKTETLAIIAHAAGVSLDWLVFGEKEEHAGKATAGNLQNKEEAPPPPANTVCGLLTSLMYLSLAKYTRNMKIEAHGHGFFYHDINISFSFVPLDTDRLVPEEDSDGYTFEKDQCDTVSYLVQGLRALSCPTFRLLEMPTNDSTMLEAKIRKYNEILHSIPQNQTLLNYECERHKHFVPLWQNSEDFFPNNFLPIKKENRIFLPEKY